MATQNPFYIYYTSQLGGSALPYYQSRFGVQGGRGFLGNLFRDAWSYLRPILGSAAKQVGAETLNAGSNILREVIASPNEPVKEIAKRHGRAGLANLAASAHRKLSGRGRRKRQSSSGPRRARAVPAKVKRTGRSARRPPAQNPRTSTIRDIFSPVSP